MSQRPRTLASVCKEYGARWRIPVAELTSTLSGGQLIEVPQVLRERVARLQHVAELLDSLLPREVQWNFWYRPSKVNDLAPSCRSWNDSPEKFLDDMEAEISALLNERQRDEAQSEEPFHVSRLFKPALMSKRLDLKSGCVTMDVVLEATPISHRPLRFAPSQHAHIGIPKPSVLEELFLLRLAKS